MTGQAPPGGPGGASPPDPITGRDGEFIDLEIADEVRSDRELAAKLAEACPVDIFAAGDGGIEIVRSNLDECVLCGLCLDAAPPGAVRVVKLYDGGATLERSA